MDNGARRSANAREFRSLVFNLHGDQISQCDYTLKYINMYGSITPREALDAFGCLRLGARIADLRRRGFAIMTTTNEGRKRYAIYSFMEEGEQE